MIERPAESARITIHTARPGIVIGKKGEDVDKLRAAVSREMGIPVHINIEEIRKPDLDATLVAQNVAQQLERRVMFRRAMKLLLLFLGTLSAVFRTDFEGKIVTAVCAAILFVIAVKYYLSHHRSLP